MICVKLTCSCSIALTKFWDDLKMWLLFPCNFSQLFPTQNATPSTRHGDCSTAHQRRLAKLPQVFQHRRQVVHRDERLAVLGAHAPLVGVQDSAQQRHGLGEGAALLQHVRKPRPWSATGAEKFPRLHGGDRAHVLTICFVVAYFWIQVPGGKTRFWDSICCDFTWAVATGYTFWCYLMLVVNNCGLLRSTAFTLQLCGISGSKSMVTRQYSSWLNSTCLLMCWSLWRDWGPHRCSAKSANPCAGPNLSAVASARHRSLGPWWCLSHGCAYHMAMRWSTMSPTWKTNQFQENGQRYAKSSRCGTGSRLQSEAGYWAAIHGPCFAGSSTICFYAWGWGRPGFLKLADVCPKCSG